MLEKIFLFISKSIIDNLNFNILINNDFILSIIFFGITCILVGAGYLVGTVFLNQPEPTYEKISSYECGFDAFSDAREQFDIKFYLIAILFIIFDVEVLFFFPWIISINELSFYGYYIMLYFMYILLLGFFYEWRKGCMDWE
jgi:NADH-quinone oxidoreductase subunit A